MDPLKLLNDIFNSPIVIVIPIVAIIALSYFISNLITSYLLVSTNLSGNKVDKNDIEKIEVNWYEKKCLDVKSYEYFSAQINARNSEESCRASNLVYGDENPTVL